MFHNLPAGLDWICAIARAAWRYSAPVDTRNVVRRETALALQSVGSGNSNQRRVTQALEVIRPNPSVLKVQNLIREIGLIENRADLEDRALHETAPETAEIKDVVIDGAELLGKLPTIRG